MRPGAGYGTDGESARRFLADIAWSFAFERFIVAIPELAFLPALGGGSRVFGLYLEVADGAPDDSNQVGLRCCLRHSRDFLSVDG